MSRLRFNTQWLDPKGVQGPELRATWGALRIEIRQSAEEQPAVVTRVYDPKVDSRRFELYLPLYPLAEWLALHWFQLLRGNKRHSERDHDIRYGSEGYALPRLEFYSEGADVRIVWKAFHDSARNLEFDSSGEVLLPRAEVESSLREFIDKVIYRLNERSISNTPLQKEWQEIFGLDPEEREFCIAAATLGLDPFNLSDDKKQQIIEVDTILPDHVLEEFLPAAAADDVIEQARAIAEAVRELEGRRRRNINIERARAELRKLTPSFRVWETGYEVARGARKWLNIPCGPVPSELLRDITDPHPLELARAPRVEGITSINCSMGASGIARTFLDRRQSSVKFMLARLLGDLLVMPDNSNALLTLERTSRQKLNRAFAAEFLAPAGEIKHRLTGTEASRDVVQSIADEFDVSEWVIENQILNHRLATISD